MGLIMLDFTWNTIEAGKGFAELAKPMYDKRMWDDDGSWFKAPTVRGVMDIAVSVAAGILTGPVGAAMIGLADDLLFAGLDLGGGYKSADQVGLELGTKIAVTAVSAGISAGSGALFKNVDGVLGKAAVAAGTSYVTSVSTGFINSVNWNDLGGDWFDEDKMRDSVGIGAIASALSAGAAAGISAGTSAKLASLKEDGDAIGKFYGGAIKLGTAAAGKTAEYAGYAAYSLATSGTLADAYDDMGGITLNLANLGSLIDLVGVPTDRKCHGKGAFGRKPGVFLFARCWGPAPKIARRAVFWRPGYRTVFPQV
jgi:hypothetical protein